MAVAGLGDAAAGPAGTAGVLTRVQAQITPELGRTRKASQVADLRRKGGRCQAVEPAQGHDPSDQRGEVRLGPRLRNLVVHRLDPLAQGLDQVHILLEHDLLHRAVELHRFQPAEVGLGPAVLAGVALAVPQQEAPAAAAWPASACASGPPAPGSGRARPPGPRLGPRRRSALRPGTTGPGKGCPGDRS